MLLLDHPEPIRPHQRHRPRRKYGLAECSSFRAVPALSRRQAPKPIAESARWRRRKAITGPPATRFGCNGGTADYGSSTRRARCTGSPRTPRARKCSFASWTSAPRKAGTSATRAVAIMRQPFSPRWTATAGSPPRRLPAQWIDYLKAARSHCAPSADGKTRDVIDRASAANGTPSGASMRRHQVHQRPANAKIGPPSTMPTPRQPHRQRPAITANDRAVSSPHTPTDVLARARGYLLLSGGDTPANTLRWRSACVDGLRELSITTTNPNNRPTTRLQKSIAAASVAEMHRGEKAEFGYLAHAITHGDFENAE